MLYWAGIGLESTVDKKFHMSKNQLQSNAAITQVFRVQEIDRVIAVTAL